jgi:hypothetical protein
MVEGHFKLACQSGGKGYYGEVRLATRSVCDRGLVIDFAPGCEAHWRIGAEFGITYGWELVQFSRSRGNGLVVTVLDIRGQPVDTTNLVVAFVAANALWNALGSAPEHSPSFDATNGRFTFPKF